MPMPQAYQRAGPEFDRLLIELCDDLNLTTRNQAYTVLQSVLIVFRRRLVAHDVLRFAALLPPIVRAILVADWTPNEHCTDFGSSAELFEEVRAIRRDHNFSDENAIHVVTQALRRRIDANDLEVFVSDLTEGAKRFWEM